MKRLFSVLLLLVIVFGLLLPLIPLSIVYATAPEWTFNANSTGSAGSIQEFVVSASGTYRITAFGAQGGVGTHSGIGGLGARVSGLFVLYEHEVIDILVGQQGANTEVMVSGGGGTFVVRDDVFNTGTGSVTDILVIAGGGGGFGVGDTTTQQEVAHAHIEMWGKDGFGGYKSGSGGTSGGAGETFEHASLTTGGGGGFFESALTDPGGQSFVDGGLGGVGDSSHGGFGGGGGTDGSHTWGFLGGGGGFSGGGVGIASDDASEGAGGGGGSYNSSGFVQDNESAINYGDGQVVITFESSSTEGPPPVIPTVSTLEVVTITTASAELRGQIDSDGYADCEARFRYGLEGSGSWTETEWQNSLNTISIFSELVAGLIPYTDYDFQAQARNSAGESAWTASRTFLTDPVHNPGVEVSASNLAGSVLTSPKERNIFYSNGLWWYFYSTFWYRTSEDGIDWSEPTYVEDITVSDYVLHNDVIHYACITGVYPGQAFNYRSGSLETDGTITWNTTLTNIGATAVTAGSVQYSVNTYDLALDSDGFPVFVYTVQDGTYYYLHHIRSGTTDGTWSTAAGYPIHFLIHNRSTHGNFGDVSLDALTNGDLLVTHRGASTSSTYYQYFTRYINDAEAWTARAQFYTLTSPSSTWISSTISSDDRVFWCNSRFGIGRHYDGVSSWTPTPTRSYMLSTDMGTYSVALGTSIYQFWRDDYDGSIYAFMYSVGEPPYASADWSTPRILFTADSLAANFSVTPNDNNDEIGIVYSRAEGLGYNVYFHSLTTQLSMDMIASAVNVTSTSADLSLNVINTFGADITGAYFNYGDTLSMTESTDIVTDLSVGDTWLTSITSLDRVTTYYFQPVADYVFGSLIGEWRGAVRTFVTLPTQPVGRTLTPANVDETSVLLRGTVDDGGGVDCYVRFQYSLSSGMYDHETPWVQVSDGTTYAYVLQALDSNTTYYYRFQYRNFASATLSGSEVSFITSMGLPVIDIRPATNVAVTMAVLNAFVERDGGVDCYVRFQYGLPGDPHEFSTAWDGPFRRGDSVSTIVVDLSLDTGYTYRAQIYNTVNSAHDPANSLSQTFLTYSYVGSVSNLRVVEVSSNQVMLSWSRGLGAYNTIIRSSTHSFPSTFSDGTGIYTGTGSSIVISDLQPGTTYFFAAWGQTPPDHWSTNSATVAVTTTGEAVVVGLMLRPPEASWWFLNPSPDKVRDLPGFGILEWQAEVLGAPLGSWLCIISVMSSAFLAGVFLVLSRSSLVALIVAGVVCFAGAMAGLTPLWILFAIVVMGMTVIYLTPVGRNV